MHNLSKEELRQIVYSVNMRLNSLGSTIKSNSIDDATKRVLMQDIIVLKNLMTKLNVKIDSGMSESLNITGLSNMITEDPDINEDYHSRDREEARSAWAADGYPNYRDNDGDYDYDSGSREYEDEEVPLGRGAYGKVLYFYTAYKIGEYRRETYESPAEYPEIEIKLNNTSIEYAFDENGKEIEIQPEYQKAAEDYFHRELIEKLVEREEE